MLFLSQTDGATITQPLVLLKAVFDIIAVLDCIFGKWKHDLNRLLVFDKLCYKSVIFFSLTSPLTKLLLQSSRRDNG